MTRTRGAARWLLVACTAAIAACGGGGGGSNPTAGGGGGGSDPTAGGTAAGPAAPTVVTLGGTAATGAPFAGAAITVTDKTGAGVGSTTAAADGSYSVTLPAGAVAPFVLTAGRDDERLVSVADGSQATVNITPITNLIASRLSASGDPAKLAGEVAAGATAIDAARIAAKRDEIVALIKPVRDQIGDATDPLNGSFKADGTGADRLIDSLAISIVPASSASANIEIRVKQADASATPNAIMFDSSGPTPATPLAAPAAASLVPAGTSAQIADLLGRITACYALPLSSRISAGGTTASAITAPQCRTIFLNDDPASWLSNGSRVGLAGNFSGIFLDSATGLKFDRGNYAYGRSNGDVVFTYAYSDGAGNSTPDTLVARPVTSAATGRTELKLVGNQYTYPGRVFPYHQLRRFVTLNQSGADYYSSGYVLVVPNRVDSNGRPIFDRVDVTTPSGAVLTLKPTVGGSELNFMFGNGSVSGTNFLRLARAHANGAAADPAARDTSLFFSAQRYTDDEITRIGEQSVWTFRYYLASAPAQVAATQSYRAVTRALSIAELRTRGLAELDPGSLSALQALADPATGNLAPLPARGPLALAWTVPPGAIAPTATRLYGRFPGGSFNDSAPVPSTARSGSIACSVQTSADTHCASGGFAAGAAGTGIDLFARDSRDREYASFYAAYRLQ